MATETLLPNAAGDETAISSTTGATHWGVCNDTNDATYVFDTGTTGVFKRDLFNLDNSAVGAGTINSVTVYAKLAKDTNGFNDQTISIKTNGTVYDYTVTMSRNDEVVEEFNTGALTVNPQTSAAWTWTEINALQAGPRIRSWSTGTHAKCSEIRVVVDYTATGSNYTKDLTETITITETQQKDITKNLNDTATITDTAQKDTSKAFSDSFTVTDAVATLVVSLVELAESITVTDTIQRAVGKVVAETATITDSIKRGLARTWSEAVTITDSVTALTATYTKELLETVSITDTVSRLSGYARNFVESLTITDRLYGLLNGVNMEYVDTYTDTVDEYVDQYFNV